MAISNSIVEEKIQIIFRFVHYTMASGFLGAICLAGIATLAPSANYNAIGGWFGLASLNFIARYTAFVRSQHLSPDAKVLWSTRGRWHLLLSGSVWGLASALFIPTLLPAHQVAFVIVLLGLNITSIPLMSDTRSITMLFLPAWLPVAYAFHASEGAFAIAFAVLCMLGYVYLVAFIVRATLDDFIAVRHQRDDAVRALQSVNVKLEDTNATQMSFFLAASHDFRQPLQAMQFYVLTLKSRLKPHAIDLGDTVEKLELTFDNLEHLIDETIGLAKISLSDAPAPTEAVSATALIAPMMPSFLHVAQSKGLRFRVRCEDDCMLSTNAEFLKRILDNLISNALRNTKRGGILIAFRRRGDICNVEVWDTGFGIPAYERERVFDAFYRGQGNQHEHKGHGLGLMIVKQLSEKIGAKLTLLSRVNKGTMFRLKIPLVVAPIKTDTTIALNRDVSLDGHTIAIVDDDHSVRDSLKKYLTAAGATVFEAHDSKTLLLALQGINKLSLLLTDLHLGNELGNDIAAKVVALHPMSKSIILTGDTNLNTHTVLKDAGFTVLTKPVKPELLLAHIAAKLGIMPAEADASI